MDILASVSGGGVCVAKVVDGQLNGTDMGNRLGRTLYEVIRQYEGGSNRLLVEDCEFGTGYHRVTTHCGAGGAGWGYRLVPLLSWEAACAAVTKDPTKTVVAVAFEKLDV